MKAHNRLREEQLWRCCCCCSPPPVPVSQDASPALPSLAPVEGAAQCFQSLAATGGAPAAAAGAGGELGAALGAAVQVLAAGENVEAARAAARQGEAVEHALKRMRLD